MGETKKTESKFCKDCGQYSRKTKMCNDLKYVPRKGLALLDSQQDEVD